MGDIFSLKWSPELSTLYLGCQNTSIQWIILEETSFNHSISEVNEQRTLQSDAIPVAKPHKFFDSAPPIRKLARVSSAASVSGSSTPRSKSTSVKGATPSLLNEGHLVGGRSSDLHPEMLQKATAKLRLKEDEPISPTRDAFESEDASTSSTVIPLQIQPSSQVPSAHSGYIYALALLSLPAYGTVLASGSGDGEIRIWRCRTQAEEEGGQGSLELLATLETSPRGEVAVLALSTWSRSSPTTGTPASSHTLFAGLQGGLIDVFDLETFTLIRTLVSHQDDVLSLVSISQSENEAADSPEQNGIPIHSSNSLSAPCLYSGSADGELKKWNENFVMKKSWKAHDGIVLSAGLVNLSKRRRQKNSLRIDQSEQRGFLLVTGSSDKFLKFWDVSLPTNPSNVSQGLSVSVSDPTASSSTSQGLLSSLSKFISFQSVSASPSHREDCRQAAHWLKGHLGELGAHAQVLPSSVKGGNPSVLATFRANKIFSNQYPQSPHGRRSSSSPSRHPNPQRCLFYGHYDCISASGSWDSPPWSLTGRDGYLYSRGVSDNKGPILATAQAASQLLSKGKLECDLVMLIEGEEENGSIGFRETLNDWKKELGRIVSLRE